MQPHVKMTSQADNITRRQADKKMNIKANRLAGPGPELGTACHHDLIYLINNYYNTDNKKQGNYLAGSHA